MKKTILESWFNKEINLVKRWLLKVQYMANVEYSTARLNQARPETVAEWADLVVDVGEMFEGQWCAFLFHLLFFFVPLWSSSFFPAFSFVCVYCGVHLSSVLTSVISVMTVCVLGVCVALQPSIKSKSQKNQKQNWKWSRGTRHFSGGTLWSD